MARIFNGNAANYLSADDDLGISAHGYTIALRIKFNDVVNRQIIFGQQWDSTDGENDNYSRLWFISQGLGLRVSANSSAGATSNATTTADPTADTWHDFIVIGQADGRSRIIALGEDVTGAATGTLIKNAPKFVLGKHDSGSFQAVDGQIKDLIVWDKELSAAEISEYQAGSSIVAEADQTRRWTFDTDSLVDDVSGVALVENGDVGFDPTPDIKGFHRDYKNSNSLLTLPSGWVEGDTLVGLAYDSVNTVITVGDWTDHGLIQSNTGIYIRLLTKVATANESDPLLTVSDGGNAMVYSFATNGKVARYKTSAASSSGSGLCDFPASVTGTDAFVLRAMFAANTGITLENPPTGTEVLSLQGAGVTHTFHSNTYSNETIPADVYDYGGGTRNTGVTLVIEPNVESDTLVARGSATVAANTTSVTLTAGVDYPAPSDTSRAYLRITGAQSNSGGSEGGEFGGNLQSHGVVYANPESLDTSIIFERYGSTFETVTLTYEVIEYVGAAGGANEFIVRHNEVVAFTTGVDITKDSSAITGIVNPSDCIPFLNGAKTSDNGRGEWEQCLATGEVFADKVTLDRAHNSGTDTHSLTLVEFIGSNYTVQRVEHAYTGTALETETVSVADYTKTALYVQQRGENLIRGSEVGDNIWLSDNTTLNFDKYAVEVQTSVVWMLENPYFQIAEYSGTATGSGTAAPTSGTITIADIPDINAVSIFDVQAQLARNSEDADHAMISMSLTDSTTVSWSQGMGKHDLAYRFQVLEWPTGSGTISVSNDLEFLWNIENAATGDWTPADITTLAWYDADDAATITDDGSNGVTQWDDKSGNGLHAAQGTATLRPFTGVETLGGKNAISFFNDHLISPVTALLNDRTSIGVIFVYENDQSSLIENAILGTQTGGDEGFVVRIDTAGFGGGGTNLYKSAIETTSSANQIESSSSVAYVGSKQIIMRRWEQGFGSEFRIDGATDTPTYDSSLTTGTTSNASQILLGDGNTGALMGNLGEVIYFDGLSTDIEKLEGYLAHKWGLSANLPANHTYKSAAPTNGGGGSTSVENSLESIWNIYQATSGSLDLRFNILQAVENSVSIDWSLLQSVVSSVDLNWTIFNSVDSSLQIDWNMFGIVAGSLGLEWNLLQAVDQQIGLDWNVLQKAESGVELRFNILQQASQALGIEWDIFQPVERSVQILWDNQGALNEVSAGLSIEWSILNAVEQVLESEWNILQSVGVDLELRHNIAQHVAQSLEVQFNTLNAVEQSIELTWNSIESVNGVLELNWTIQIDEFRSPINQMIIVEEGRIMTVLGQNRKMTIQ